MEKESLCNPTKKRNRENMTLILENNFEDIYHIYPQQTQKEKKILLIDI